MNVDKGKEKCRMCRVKPASFYSLYQGKKINFCSRPCHEKYNTQKAKAPNVLLIQLDKEKTEDELQNTKEDDIFKACHRGEENSDKLRALLEEGASPNQTNNEGQTLLTYSIAKGDIRTLRVLLSAGADVDGVDSQSKTPLMVAATIGADKNMGLLLKRGANAMLQDAEGKTALHMTESNTTPDCANLLLQHQPGLVNVKNNFDQTAVHLVAGAGNNLILSTLLNHGASVDGLDNLGRAPVHYAVFEKAETCIPLLLNAENGTKVLDLADRFGSSPVHYAVQHNNPGILNILLEKGCDVNASNPAGRTPLLLAAAEGGWNICNILVEKCGDINATDKEGFSALHYAARAGRSKLCVLLIKHGADVNLRNNQEQTPMFPAVCNAHTEVVHTLVEKGAKCDAIMDARGRHPSHYAAELGLKPMLRLLLQYSEVCDGEGCEVCDPDDNPIHAKDDDGHTTLYLAVVNKHVDCLKMLVKRGVQVDPESYKLLAEMGLVDIVDKERRAEDPVKDYECEEYDATYDEWEEEVDEDYPDWEEEFDEDEPEWEEGAEENELEEESIENDIEPDEESVDDNLELKENKEEDIPQPAEEQGEYNSEPEEDFVEDQNDPKEEQEEDSPEYEEEISQEDSPEIMPSSSDEDEVINVSTVVDDDVDIADDDDNDEVQNNSSTDYDGDVSNTCSIAPDNEQIGEIGEEEDDSQTTHEEASGSESEVSLGNSSTSRTDSAESSTDEAEESGTSLEEEIDKNARDDDDELQNESRHIAMKTFEDIAVQAGPLTPDKGEEEVESPRKDEKSHESDNEVESMISLPDREDDGDENVQKLHAELGEIDNYLKEISGNIVKMCESIGIQVESVDTPNAPHADVTKRKVNDDDIHMSLSRPKVHVIDKTKRSKLKKDNAHVLHGDPINDADLLKKTGKNALTQTEFKNADVNEIQRTQRIVPDGLFRMIEPDVDRNAETGILYRQKETKHDETKMAEHLEGMTHVGVQVEQLVPDKDILVDEMGGEMEEEVVEEEVRPELTKVQQTFNFGVQVSPRSDVGVQVMSLTPDIKDAQHLPEDTTVAHREIPTKLTNDVLVQEVAVGGHNVTPNSHRGNAHVEHKPGIQERLETRRHSNIGIQVTPPMSNKAGARSNVKEHNKVSKTSPHTNNMSVQVGREEWRPDDDDAHNDKNKTRKVQKATRKSSDVAVQVEDDSEDSVKVTADNRTTLNKVKLQPIKSHESVACQFDQETLNHNPHADDVAEKVVRVTDNKLDKHSQIANRHVRDKKDATSRSAEAVEKAVPAHKLESNVYTEAVEPDPNRRRQPPKKMKTKAVQTVPQKKKGTTLMAEEEVTFLKMKKLSSNPTVWKKKYNDQRKRTLLLEDRLNKLKLQLDQNQRRVVSTLERRQEKGNVQRRLREPQQLLCQQTHDNEMLRSQVEVLRTKMTSETMLRNLRQKELNEIRSLRDDYRNAYKTFAPQQQVISRLLDKPDWLTRKSPMKSKWTKASRKVSSQLLSSQNGEDYNEKHRRRRSISNEQSVLKVVKEVEDRPFMKSAEF